MSSYIRTAQNPITKKWEQAFAMDDFFGPHLYAIVFRDGHVYSPLDIIDCIDEEGIDDGLTWGDYPKKLYIDSKQYKRQYPFVGK